MSNDEVTDAELISEATKTIKVLSDALTWLRAENARLTALLAAAHTPTLTAAGPTETPKGRPWPVE